MDSKEAKKRMMEGRIYPPGDEEIMAEQVVCMQKLWEYNQIQPKDMDKRFAKLQDMLPKSGKAATSSLRCTPTSAESMCISGKMCMQTTI